MKRRSLMVRISDELHKSVRVKSAELDLSISEVVRRLLESWVTGAIELPKEQEDVISDSE